MITRQRRLLLYGRGIMMNLHSILCKVNTTVINYVCCLKPTVPFFPVSTILTMTTFSEVAVQCIVTALQAYVCKKSIKNLSQHIIFL